MAIVVEIRTPFPNLRDDLLVQGKDLRDRGDNLRKRIDAQRDDHRLRIPAHGRQRACSANGWPISRTCSKNELVACDPEGVPTHRSGCAVAVRGSRRRPAGRRGLRQSGRGRSRT